MELPLQQNNSSNVLFLDLSVDKILIRTLSGENIEQIQLDGFVNETPTLISNNNNLEEQIADSECDKLNSELRDENDQSQQSIPKKNKIKKQITYSCVLCQKTFSKLMKYQFHMAKHQASKKYQCEFCISGFNKEVNFKIHMVNHNNDLPICPICDRKFQRHASLKAHVVQHQVEETYFCLHCNVEFNYESELYTHLEVHEGENIETTSSDIPRNCDYCNYQFYDGDKYKEHLLSHIQAKRFVANHKFRTKRKGKHRNYEHVCQVCSKSFSKPALLERHFRVHTGEKPFICPTCNKGFSQNSTLQIHMNSHEGRKPFKCMLCKACFVQRGNLRSHLLKTHTVAKPDEKVYKCSHCTCVYKKLSSLNGHVTRVHCGDSEGDVHKEIQDIVTQLKELDRKTGTSKPPLDESNANDKQEAETRTDKPIVTYVKIADSSINGNIHTYTLKQRTVGEHRWYICSFCNKEFKKPSDLIRHRRIHTREKPYECPDCGIAFAQKSTVVNHRATHEKNQFECVICKKKFGSIRSLNVHLKKHDNKLNEVKSTSMSPLYKCSLCPETFTALKVATAHINSHDPSAEGFIQQIEQQIPKENLLQPLVETEQGTFAVLPKGSRHNADLQRVRPYKCSICNMAFVRKTHCERHVANHNSKREFACPVCSKTFATQTALKEHTMYHTKPRRFSCAECSKTFLNQSMLLRHSLTHKTTRAFICPYCKKRFKMKEHCQKHIARHNISIATVEQSNNAPLDIVDNQEIQTENMIMIDDLIDNDIMNLSSNGQELVEAPINDEIVTQTVVPQEPPQIHIQESANSEWLYNINNIQILGNENIITELLPSLKIQKNDQELLEQIPDIQTMETNYVTSDVLPINNELFTTNMLFNSDLTNLQLPSVKPTTLEDPTLDSSKDIQFDMNAIVAEGLTTEVPKSNIILTDANPENNGVNYYILSNFLELSQLQQLEPTKITETEVAPVEELPKTVEEVPQENPVPPSEESQYDKAYVITDPNVGNATQREVFQCANCNKEFKDKFRLNMHIAAKHKHITTNVCEYCHKVFKKKSDKDRHVRTHTGERPYACTKCEKSFAIKSTLDSHMRTHNPRDTTNFQCKVCNAYLSCKASLRMHTFSHADREPFACEVCKKQFKHKHHLTAHFQIHTNLKKNTKVNAVNMLQTIAFEASSKINEDQLVLNTTTNEEFVMADKLFEQEIPVIVDNMEPVTITLAYDPNNLDINLDANTIVQGGVSTEAEEIQAEPVKEKKYECDICHKFYATNSVLRKHKRVVHGDFKCDKCSKAFNSAELLEKHYSSHYGHRPFNCTLCINSFSKEADLKVHFKRMHTTENE